MRHFVGLKDHDLTLRKEAVEVFYDTDDLLTGHMMILGMSGSGKSFQSRSFLRSAAAAGVQIDIFDVHEELDDIPNAKAVKFSQHTGYGYNPLLIDLDPHVGGPMRAVDFLVDLISSTSASKLGANQISALRNLILATYAAHGIVPDQPHTWRRKIITEEQRAALIAGRREAELGQYYPTLTDLIMHARRKVLALTIGTDNPTVNAFTALIGTVKKLNRANTALGKKMDEAEIEKGRIQVKTLIAECEDLYAKHMNTMQTGEEPEDVVRFESATMVNTLAERLEVLSSAGIFRSNTPPFEGTTTRVHQIKALTDQQKIMFVKLRLRALWEYYKKMGPTKSGTEIRHVLFIDEAHQFFDAGRPADILNVLLKEGRKFGVALWVASQSLNGFPEDIIANVGATVIMGLHPLYWQKAKTILRLDETVLTGIKAKEIIAIRLQESGAADPPFMNIVVPNGTTDHGRLSAARASRHLSPASNAA